MRKLVTAVPIRTALLSTLLLMLFVSATALAQEEGRRGGTLTIGYQATLHTFDVMAETGARDEIVQMVFEQLVTIDENLAPAPLLAESWEISEDELAWTFRLRPGVAFHDGSSLTADDVVASFERLQRIGARRAEFSRIEEVAAVDDHTVSFYLSEPWGLLADTFAMLSGGFVIHPKHILDRVGDSRIEPSNLEDIVGTGPYRLVGVVPDQEYRFARYEEYQQPSGEPSGWAGRRYQYPDEIVVIPILESATRSAALFAGEIDFAVQIAPDDLARLEADSTTKPALDTAGRRVGLALNSQVGPFTDLLLRRAVRAAIDSEAAMATQGPRETWAVDNTGIRFQSAEERAISAEYFAADLALARYLVEQSSYDGEPIRYITRPGDPDSYRPVPVIAEALTDIGLNVQVEVLDDATFVERRRQLDSHEIEPTSGTTVVAMSYNEAAARDRTGGRWSWVTPEWDFWMDVIATTSDEERRAEALWRLNRLHLEGTGALNLGEVFLLHGARHDVHNLPTTYHKRFFDIWLDRP